MIHKLTTRNRIALYFESDGKRRLVEALITYRMLKYPRDEERFVGWLVANGFCKIDAQAWQDDLDLPFN